MGETELVWKIIQNTNFLDLEEFLKNNIFRKEIQTNIIKLLCQNGEINKIYLIALMWGNDEENLLAETIIKSKKVDFIYTMALRIKNAPIKLLAQAIIDIGISVYIFEFAESVKDAPISLLAEAIIKLQSPLYIYLFALNVKTAPIDELARAIIKTGDIFYIKKFMTEVPGISADILNMMTNIVNNSDKLESGELNDDIIKSLLANGFNNYHFSFKDKQRILSFMLTNYSKYYGVLLEYYDFLNDIRGGGQEEQPLNVKKKKLPN